MEYQNRGSTGSGNSVSVGAGISSGFEGTGISSGFEGTGGTNISGGSGDTNISGSASVGGGAGVASNLSYQEFQKIQHIRQEQAAAQAQQAIQSIGLDSFSQQVNNTIQRLRQIGKDLAGAQQQLAAQMAAQQRQLQQMEQHIDSICNQLASSYKASSGKMLQ